MVALMKRDLYLYGWSLLMVVVFLPISTGVPPELVFLALALALTVHLFFYDNRASVNRFIVSLPVTKQMIIYSRYLVLLIMSAVLLLLQWVVHQVFVDIMGAYVYHVKDLIANLSFFLIISAIAVPMYYAIESIAKIFYIQLGLFFVGNLVFSFFVFRNHFSESDGLYIDNTTVFLAGMFERVIPFQPFLILPIIAVVMFIGSMKLSIYYLVKKTY